MHFVQEVRRHPVRGWKTLAQFSCYMMLGMSVGVLGPSLLDLKTQVATDLSHVSLVMTSRAAGHVVGSLASESRSLVASLVVSR